QEAALRMFHNNLDPEVAEHPEELVVYGGTGKAARDWRSFERITASLRDLERDETLLVQSGKPVGIMPTHEWAPRGLIASRDLRGRGCPTMLRNLGRHHHPHRRAGRYGWCPTLGGDHERRGGDRGRVRPEPYRPSS